MSRPATPPVVLSSTFGFDDAEAMIRAATERDAALYTRWSNPTIDHVEGALAALEGADFSLLTGSGMAAISVALMGARRDGELLVQREVYGGTHELVEHLLKPLGVSCQRAGLDELVEAARSLPPGSMIYLETPTNPLLRVVDIAAVRAAAPVDARIAVDATFATPINLRPLEQGADLVIHSASKYLSGHHDLVAGVVSGKATLREALWSVRKLLGPVLDPAAAYRLWRGMETLGLRVARQNATAAELARRLTERGCTVHHPSLEHHPDRDVVSRTMQGGGGVLSFELADRPSAERCLNSFKVISRAPSLGGTRSVATWPAGVSHVGLSEEARKASGIPEGLVRLAVGLEDVEVLWGELEGSPILPTTPAR